MLNLKSKWMIGFFVCMVALFYIDALVTGPLQKTKKVDNINVVDANI